MEAKPDIDGVEDIPFGGLERHEKLGYAPTTVCDGLSEGKSVCSRFWTVTLEDIGKNLESLVLDLNCSLNSETNRHKTGVKYILCNI